MKRSQIHGIIPHFVQSVHSQSLSDRIADLHAQVIENRLGQLDLTTEQKLTIVDQIMANIKSDGIGFLNFSL